jgi:ABC-type polysaccharide/polyol phosphate transport system ATPase subunit
VSEDVEVDDDVSGLIPEVGPVQEVDLPPVEEVRIDPPPWPSAPSIVVDGVAKWYDSSHRGHLRFAMPRALPTEPPPGAVIALDHADLAIGDGQSIGIIGNNGAGKSTILKLIAGVTPPSRGEVRVKGRVASMIELGLGFHPDMTGTENLFFAAALLGMSKRTLRSRWDDIVDFSGVAHALDQPVKHYSSGMLARLGFALASHSDADVILVDEVLSVGDFDFQRRSLERIMKLNREGRTTVIVTHNLDALPPLCHRIVQLEKGRVVADGTPAQVIPDYVAQEAEKYAAHGNDAVHISNVEVVPGRIHPSGAVTVRGIIETTEPLEGCRAVVRVGMGQALIAYAGESDKQTLARLIDEPLDIRLDKGPGRWQVEATIESVPLFAGDYIAGLAVIEHDMTELVSLTLPLDILGAREEWMSIRVRLDENNTQL